MGSDSAVRRRARAAHLGPERRRPQVLDAALSIAAEEGIAAVTMGAVADHMAVTRPVVYACFPDRVQLIDALIEREEAFLISGVLDVLPPRTTDADETVFVEGFRALLHKVAGRPSAWRLLYGNPDPAVAGSFGRGRSLAVARCTELLRPTLHAWGVTDAERKLPALVELWVSAGEGAVRTLFADGSAWDPDDLGEFVGAAVYRAMRAA
ncbi:TetR/AcrR family transcriptional regulator [Nocardia asteroides]|uniref:TetR/AcrR family transcriptional regulator n=1 Tax=Nocardia asteroides TaxID=1824 RepID=UPI0004C1B65E|nr:TetR/AcrR family transcriptional regulator [Nocardia asteroides]TLF66552.1 TetR/AcrR family transcriptional regulator [Nocardia asteroides NBRC 15531]UGT46349.1 TetR/AcrR family transcriptional regulator [Nocardia asteroides]